MVKSAAYDLRRISTITVFVGHSKYAKGQITQAWDE